MDKMHEYNIVGKSLDHVKFGILIISIPIAYSISIFFNWLEIIIDLSLWWIEIPSILGVYQWIYIKFYSELWKTKWVNKWLKIPNLEGRWEGYLQSSYDNYQTKFDVTVTIKQSLSLISIIYEMEKSTSYSISAEIGLESTKGICLKYDYINIPKIENNKELNIHLGKTELYLKDGELNGEYFNKQRNTKGVINLKRILMEGK